MKAITLGLAALLLLCPAWRLPAQDAPCSTRTVMVSVVDKGGNPVSGLTATNFSTQFRGRPVEILSATLDTRARRIVLVLDASGSMTQTPAKWEALMALSDDFYEFAPQFGLMAQIVFSSAVLARYGFGDRQPPREVLIRTKEWVDIHRGYRSRNSAIFDAIQEALMELGPTRHGDLIYVISDGEENASKTSFPELQEALLAGGIRLFATILETLDRRSLVEGMRPKVLRELAEATGGNVVHLMSYDPHFRGTRYWRTEKDRDAVLLAAARMYEQMRRSYALQVRLPLTVEKPHGWHLRVVKESGKPRRDVEVHYPRKLLPCTSDAKQD